MPRLFLTIIIAIVLISQVHAQGDTEPNIVQIEESGGGYAQAQDLQKVLANPGDVDLKQPTNFNMQGYSGIASDEVKNTGSEITFEHLQQLDHDGTHMQSGHDVSIEKDGDYTAGSVDELRQGLITIYNGVNVQWHSGVLTVDSAGSMDYKGSTSTDVVKLTADGKEFSVQRAAAVQAGCFLVEDVKIAKFVVGKTVTMTTSGDGRVVYGDGSKLKYDGLQANSTLSASVVNCLKPRYTVTNMQLTGTRGNLTEVVNGTGQIDMDATYGVVCVNLTPISTYDIDMPHVEDGFGFVIRDYAYKLCVQKNIAQKLAADCPQCGLVDLANSKLLLNGVIEYRRYWYDSALIAPQKQRAFRSTGLGKNTINLATGAVSIEQDAPDTDTVASNYLELREQQEAGATHRFLGINEKIDRVAVNWAKAYTTLYAQATTSVRENTLEYQRANCHVAVLPPGSAQIGALLSVIQQQEVRYP